MQSGSKCLTPITHVKYKKIRRLEEFSTKNLINFFLLSTTLLYLCFQSMVLIAIWLLSSTYSNYKCYKLTPIIGFREKSFCSTRNSKLHIICFLMFNFFYFFLSLHKFIQNPKSKKSQSVLVLQLRSDGINWWTITVASRFKHGSKVVMIVLMHMPTIPNVMLNTTRLNEKQLFTWVVCRVHRPVYILKPTC